MYKRQVYTEPLQFTGGLGGIDFEASRSNAIGDINNDGFIDIAVSHRSLANFHLWQNCENPDYNFVKVKLQGIQSNADAYGARIELYTGETMQVTQKVSHNAYLCQNSDIHTFGIAEGVEVDSIVVRWPFEGSVTVLTGAEIDINEVNHIVEGGGPSCVPGNSCNDGDDCTENDAYDDDCNCIGEVLSCLLYTSPSPRDA